MKNSEIRQMTVKELRKQLGDNQQQLADMYVQNRTSEQKKVHEFSVLKKRISRFKTVLREKQLMVDEAQDG